MSNYILKVNTPTGTQEYYVDSTGKSTRMDINGCVPSPYPVVQPPKTHVVLSASCGLLSVTNTPGYIDETSLPPHMRSYSVARSATTGSNVYLPMGVQTPTLRVDPIYGFITTIDGRIVGQM
jgi:hypothetical protein